MGSLQPTKALPLLRCFLVCAVLTVSGCEPANESAVDKTSAAVDEQLWLTPPEGWVLTENIADSTRHVRYVDPAEPTHSLIVESRTNATLGAPATDPLDLINQLAETERQDCTKAKDFNTFTGYEHGFATAVRLFICQADEPTTRQLTLLKIIQGQQQTYLVALEYGWSTMSNETANTDKQDGLELEQNNKTIVNRVAVWSLYIRSVRLCPASGCEQRTN